MHDGQRETRKKCGRSERERRKKMIDEHFKLLTIPRTSFYFTKIIKNKL